MSPWPLAILCVSLYVSIPVSSLSTPSHYDLFHSLHMHITFQSCFFFVLSLSLFLLALALYLPLCPSATLPLCHSLSVSLSTPLCVCVFLVSLPFLLSSPPLIKGADSTPLFKGVWVVRVSQHFGDLVTTFGFCHYFRGFSQCSWGFSH